MPKFTDSELQQLVDEGRIAGFSIDTTEFHHLGYNFQAKSLQALSQFQTTGISVVFSDVVLNEVRSHIRDDIQEKASNARSSINQFLKASR